MHFSLFFIFIACFIAYLYCVLKKMCIWHIQQKLFTYTIVNRSIKRICTIFLLYLQYPVKINQIICLQTNWKWQETTYGSSNGLLWDDSTCWHEEVADIGLKSQKNTFKNMRQFLKKTFSTRHYGETIVARGIPQSARNTYAKVW